MGDFDPATEEFPVTINRHGLRLFIKIITPPDAHGNAYLAHGHSDVHVRGGASGSGHQSGVGFAGGVGAGVTAEDTGAGAMVVALAGSRIGPALAD
jgi:hypothetical protein